MRPCGVSAVRRRKKEFLSHEWIKYKKPAVWKARNRKSVVSIPDVLASRKYDHVRLLYSFSSAISDIHITVSETTETTVVVNW